MAVFSTYSRAMKQAPETDVMSDSPNEPPSELDGQEFLFISEHERMLRRYVMALSGDTSNLDDLCQEVFLRFVERLNRLESPIKVGQFLRGIARRVVQEYFRN